MILFVIFCSSRRYLRELTVMFWFYDYTFSKKPLSIVHWARYNKNRERCFLMFSIWQVVVPELEEKTSRACQICVTIIALENTRELYLNIFKWDRDEISWILVWWLVYCHIAVRVSITFLQDLKILTFCAPHHPIKLFLVQILYLPGFAQKLPPQICDDDDNGTRSILNERSSHVLVYCSFCLTKKGPTTNPLSQHMRHIFAKGEFFWKFWRLLFFKV